MDDARTAHGIYQDAISTTKAPRQGGSRFARQIDDDISINIGDELALHKPGKKRVDTKDKIQDDNTAGAVRPKNRWRIRSPEFAT